MSADGDALVPLILAAVTTMQQQSRNHPLRLGKRHHHQARARRSSWATTRPPPVPTRYKDAAANEVVSFTTGEDGVPAVTNNSTADTTAPTVTSAEVNTTGTAVTLVFSEDLDAQAFLPTAVINAFSVSADGDALGIFSGTTISNNRIILSLASGTTIGQGQTVKLGYNKTTAGTDALKDAAANEVVSFTTGEDGVPAVTNNSTADTTAPTVTSAEVNTTGTAVTLVLQRRPRRAGISADGGDKRLLRECGRRCAGHLQRYYDQQQSNHPFAGQCHQHQAGPDGQAELRPD